MVAIHLQKTPAQAELGRATLSVLHFSSSLHRVQRVRQVCLEIVDVFETDVQAYDSVAVVRAARRRMEIVSDGQAGHTRPTVSDLEQVQRIDKSQNLRLGKLLLEDNGEQAGRAREVALPEFVSGAGGKRGM